MKEGRTMKGRKLRIPLPKRRSTRRNLNLLEIARAYLDAGLSVIPIRADGSKSPIRKWNKWQLKRPSRAELQRNFGNERPIGIGIVAGKVSGNLEILDFDDHDAFVSWCQDIPKSLLDRLPQVETPNGGRHVYYRCKAIEGNQKLAHSTDGRTLIETRGEGGYCLAPGSSQKCHKSGRPYQLVHGSTLEELPRITPEKRELLLCVARHLNQAPPVVRGVNGSSTYTDRPGDDFNQRATWENVLSPYGWAVDKQTDAELFWRRPGKGSSHSATTGFCSNGDTDLLYVFSSNAPPFEPGKAYSKFAAYALLNHSGDFKAAAKQLQSEGYGSNSDAEAIMRRLSDIEPQNVEWLLPGVIALGKLTMLSGHPGLGKSLITLDLAARLTTGRAFPDNEKVNSPSTVIALSAEDDAADTIRPRFDQAGGDPKRLMVIEGSRRKGEDSYFDLDRDIGALERALSEIPDCRLVVIDPLSAYIGKVDAHKNKDVRQLLRRLADLASKKRVAILLVDHLNKSETGSAVTRSQGSIAFVAAARIALMVSADPNDATRRLVLPIKNNLHPDRSGWGYHIIDGPVLKWEESSVQMTAQDLVELQTAKSSPRADAKDWLRTILSHGKMSVTDIKELAEEAGHTWATIRRARDELRVQSRKGRKSKNDGFMWSLPTSEPVEQPEQVEQLELPTSKAIKRGRSSNGSTSSRRSSRKTRTVSPRRKQAK